MIQFMLYTATSVKLTCIIVIAYGKKHFCVVAFVNFIVLSDGYEIGTRLYSTFRVINSSSLFVLEIKPIGYRLYICRAKKKE